MLPVAPHQRRILGQPGEPAGQICRRKYLVTDPETGETLDVEGNYILSPKDLCTIDFLDYFIESGVRVLKIEGRARGAEYVKRVVECYDRRSGPWKTATTRRNWPPH